MQQLISFLNKGKTYGKQPMLKTEVSELMKDFIQTDGNKLPILGIYFHKFFLKSFHKFENFCFRHFPVVFHKFSICALDL